MNFSKTFPSKSSYLEIHAEALRHNIALYREILNGKSTLGVVLKGNAYGHGFLEVLSVIHSLVDFIYVISPQDALKIRDFEKAQGHPSRRVLVMGALSTPEIVECAKHGIEAVISDSSWEESILALRNAKLKIQAHIHLDTGLSREGFSVDELKLKLEFLQSEQDVLSICGAMSHFANTEDVTEQGYAYQQLKIFQEGVKILEKLLNLKTPLEEHFAASAAAIVLPDSRMRAVRVGISMYGFWPSFQTQISAEAVLGKKVKFKPALSWKCKSQILKKIKKGSYVGYGCAHQCARDTWIAVFPVGYYDGYSRLFSGKAHALVNQKLCPVIGRVMMNHIVLDVTDAVSDEKAEGRKGATEELEEELEAVLLGSDGKTNISAEMLADWSQTIHYEIVTRIGAHLPRHLT